MGIRNTDLNTCITTYEPVELGSYLTSDVVRGPSEYYLRALLLVNMKPEGGVNLLVDAILDGVDPVRRYAAMIQYIKEHAIKTSQITHTGRSA